MHRMYVSLLKWSVTKIVCSKSVRRNGIYKGMEVWTDKRYKSILVEKTETLLMLGFDF
jgi:hypothetical protein